MDFAVNSGFLKKEMDAMGDDYPGLNPAKYELPDKLMYEEYLALLIEKAEKVPMFVMSLGTAGNPTPDKGDSSEKGDGESETESEGGNSKDEDDTESESTGGGSGSEEEPNEEEDPEDGDGDSDSDDTEDENNDSESGGAGEEGDDSEEEDHPEFPRHSFSAEDASSVRTEAEVERLISELTKETKEMVKQAYDQTIRRRGTVPSEIRSVIEELLKEPEVPWEEILRNMIRSSIIAKMDESAVIPNYSLLPVMGQGILPYPGLQCDTAVNISVVIDTSGSISDNDFIKFITELNGIVQCTHGVKLHIVMFDACIQYEHYMTELEADDLRAEMKSGKNSQARYGRGGTDFNPPFQCVKGVDRDEISRSQNCSGNWEEHRFQKPDLVVFLTDGCAPVSEESGGPIPMYQPDCPVIWVICGGNHAQVDPAMGQRVVVLSE
jgi:predicted metal-dependent peptidase